MDLSFLNFIDYVLSVDPVQKRTLMMGFMYHSYLLEAVAGNTNQQGLREVVVAFGLIGFTILALNRAWWKPSILISWLVITMIVMLGGRGEILTLSVDGSMVTPPSASEILSGKSMQATIRPEGNIHTDFVRLRDSSNDVLTVPLGNGTVLAYPKAADGLSKVGVFDPNQAIKAYTPIILTLYAMNRLKTVLLLSLPYPSDMVAMRAAANRVMAGAPDYPTTRYLTDIFGATCVAKSAAIKNAIDNRNGFFYPKTDWGKPQLKNFMDAMKTTTFTVQDIENINNNIYPVLTAFDQRVTYPAIGIVAEETLQKMPQYLRSTRYVNNDITMDSSSDIITMPSEFATNAALNAKRLANVNEPYFVDALTTDVLKQSASIHLISPKTATEGSTQTKFDHLTFQTCYQMFAAVNEAYGREVEPSKLDLAVGRTIAKELVENNEGNIDGTAEETVLAAVALQGALRQKEMICKDPGFWGGTSNACEKATKELQAFEKGYKEGAIRSRLGLLIASQNDVYDPGRLFKSPIRDKMADLGEILGPVALWFTALFGGFATGTYAGIIPTFISFIMALIIAVTPLMFIVGLVVPSFCPGILMTPVLVLLYLKTVEIMFVVVTAVFSMLREGIISTESFGAAGGLTGAQGVVTSIFDIVVGLGYTSMFMVAGYIFNMGSPDKILGKLGGLDGIGKIDMKEALQFGGAVALASRGVNLATGAAGSAIRAKERVAMGKSPFGGGITDFINKNRQQVRNEVAGQISRDTALSEGTDGFLARTQDSSNSALDKNRTAGQSALMRQQSSGGTLTPASDAVIMINAQAANIKSEKADIDANVANTNEVSTYQGPGQYRLDKEQAQPAANIKAQQADIDAKAANAKTIAEWNGPAQYAQEVADKQAREANLENVKAAREKMDLEANMAVLNDPNISAADRAAMLQKLAFGEHHTVANDAFKRTVKRLGYSNDAEDTIAHDRATGQDFTGSGAVEMTRTFIKTVLKEAQPGRQEHEYDALSRTHTAAILSKNKRDDLYTKSNPGGTGNAFVSSLSVNLDAPGMREFHQQFAQAFNVVLANANNGVRRGNELDLTNEMKAKGMARKP